MVSGRTPWRLVGEEVAGCNCAWGCPCQFNALPTTGSCEGIAAHQVRQGHYGSVRLDGVRFVELFWFPGPVHEGNGSYQLIVDENSTVEQREALEAITSGAEGGMPFEIYASVTPTKLKPLVAPIAFESDEERRQARVTVVGVAELQVEPIKNPVTGEEHRARIVLPGGFEFKEAEVANSVRLEVTASPPLVYEHSGTYAQLNVFDWSNG